MASLTLLLNKSSSLARIEKKVISKLGSEHLRCSPKDVVNALVLFRNVFLDKHSDYSDKKRWRHTRAKSSNGRSLSRFSWHEACLGCYYSSLDGMLVLRRVTPGSLSPVPFIHLGEERQGGVKLLV